MKGKEDQFGITGEGNLLENSKGYFSRTNKNLVVQIKSIFY